MNATSKTREIVQCMIVDAIIEFGEDFNAGPLWKEIEASGLAVNRRSYYRWVAAVRKAGGKVPPNKPLRRMRKGPPEGETSMSTSNRCTVAPLVTDELARTPNRATIRSVDYLTTLLASIDRSEHLALFFSEMVGPEQARRPRSPKYWAIAERNLQNAIYYVGKLQVDLLDLQKIRQFHQVLFARIGEQDPELVEAIIADVRELSREWGLDGTTLV